MGLPATGVQACMRHASFLLASKAGHTALDARILVRELRHLNADPLPSSVQITLNLGS
jgi:hypothetical protein